VSDAVDLTDDEILSASIVGIERDQHNSITSLRLRIGDREVAAMALAYNDGTADITFWTTAWEAVDA
jgi:hypothetical protein